MELKEKNELYFLAAGGEMGRLIRDKDWSASPLGEPHTWPASLQIALGIMLRSAYPMFIWWGRDLIMFHNDAYLPVLGKKHPAALGSKASETWSEIWPEVGPMVEKVWKGEQVFWKDLPLYLGRKGFAEETFWTFSYSPIVGENGKVAGLFCACNEETEKVFRERRFKVLQEVSELGEFLNKNESILNESLNAISRNANDSPCAAIYQLDEASNKAILFGSRFGRNQSFKFPQQVTLKGSESAEWKFDQVAAEGSGAVVNINSDELILASFLVEPLIKDGHRVFGFLVNGINPHLELTEEYSNYSGLLAKQISTLINNVEAYEAEKKRAESLLELDRAKNIFFTNLSHEFRTPLTLILGPVEDLLRQKQAGDADDSAERLKLVHQNARRLLKLVNNLLDFSNIEAGRISLSFRPIDLSDCTRNIAGSFRSAIENAGLDFIVDIPDLSQKVYADPEMYEKIVLNLLSNSFKFTMAGSIRLALVEKKNHVELIVEDTGIGIPQKELNKIFQKFHRVDGSQGRSIEGAGIGLTLVNELVKLHDGTVRVESLPRKGSKFVIEFKFGTEHLPVERIGAESVLPPRNIEANLYLPVKSEELDLEQNGKKVDVQPSRILVVDDNDDMLLYMKTLLGKKYTVDIAHDGEQALKKIGGFKPELVITDVMMPGIDGFELMNRIKSQTETASIPVIILSARAGEESKVEGLNKGADDYLVKPFSGQELLAVIDRNLKKNNRQLAKVDNKREFDLLSTLLDETPIAVAILTGDDLRFSMVNEKYEELVGRPRQALLGKMLNEALPELEGQGFDELIMNVLQTGNIYKGEKIKVKLIRNGTQVQTYVNSSVHPYYDREGRPIGIIAISYEVKDVLTEEEKAGHLAAIVQSSDVAIVSKTLEGIITSWNPSAEKIFGYTADEMIGQSITRIIPPERLNEEPEIIRKIASGEKVDHFETRRRTKSGKLIDIALTISPIKDSSGKIVGASKIARDITAQKVKSEQIKESEERFRRLADEAPLWVLVTDENMDATYCNSEFLNFLGLKDYTEFFGKAWEKYIHPEDLDRVNVTLYDSLATKQSFSIECRFRKFDTGEYIWVQLKGVPRFMNDKFIGYIGTGIVIHEQKLAKEELEHRVAQRTLELKQINEELRNQKTFVEAILDASVDIIAVIDRNLNYVALNKKGVEQYNSAKPIVGRNFLEVFPHLKDGAMHKNILRALKGEVVHDKVYSSPILNKKFENFFIPLHGSGSRIDEVLVVGHDISDIIEASEKIKSINEILEKKNRELEQTNSELASFSYVASHDLQEPLRKIRIFGKMVLEQESASLSETGLDYLNRMVSASDRMQNLIEALLDFSRTNTSEKQVERMNIVSMIEDVLHELQLKIDEKQAKIDVGYIPDLFIIPIQFRQLLHNIINNSLKYSKNDEPPLITIKSQVIPAEETGEKEAVKGMDYCRITIQDNGIGFEPQYSEKIFELFQRLHGRNEFTGSGIGLAICKKIAKNHNGFIRAEGKPGIGARFDVFIPC